MRHRLLGMLTVLSVAIWIAAGASWVRSCWASDTFELSRRDAFRSIESPAHYHTDRDGARIREGDTRPLWHDRNYYLYCMWGTVQIAGYDLIHTDFPFLTGGAPQPVPTGKWRSHVHSSLELAGTTWPWVPQTKKYPGVGAKTWSWAGFSASRQTVRRPESDDDPRVFSSWSVAIPDWFMMSMATVAPVAWWRSYRFARRRRRWIATDRCSECGYDLRHRPPRCPECGAASASPASRLDPPPQPADNPS
jgi:hypothetical protein